jgi:exodeoxyribonuclease-3
LKIATFNANSVRSRLPIVLKWLNAERPDVLAVQETKVMDDQFPRADFENAGWHAAIRGQKSYNGVAFFSRKPLDSVDATWDPSGSGEARTLVGRMGEWLLINTYVPQGFEPDSPKFENKLKFYAGLKKLFAKHVRPDAPALWMGDLNVAPTEIDLWDPKLSDRFFFRDVKRYSGLPSNERAQSPLQVHWSDHCSRKSRLRRSPVWRRLLSRRLWSKPKDQ